MQSARDKMLAGELYDPLDPELVRARERARDLCPRVFFNFNCVVLDVCEVRIGDCTLFGPGVQILTPLHPLDPGLRRKQEFGKPIEIGADVWVGGGGRFRGRQPLPGNQGKRMKAKELLKTLKARFETGGEPDVIGHDRKTGEYLFYDCSAESPKGRRSVCYDREGLESRKEFKPKNSAVEMAAAMGIELQDPRRHPEARRRPVRRPALRHRVRVSQQRALLLCGEGLPGLAQGLTRPERGKPIEWPPC